jgi:hypothetical protein
MLQNTRIEKWIPFSFFQSKQQDKVKKKHKPKITSRPTADRRESLDQT